MILEGAVIMEAGTLIQEPEMKLDKIGQLFASSVQKSLQSYFLQLDSDNKDPTNLYSIVLAEIEIPLLRLVMHYTKSNQSKAAKILGISRGTLRKKLAIYQINELHR